MSEETKIVAKNKKASYQYFLTDKFTAGIELLGTEIKSIRDGKVNLIDSFCLFQNGVLVVRNLYIQELHHI